MFMKVLTLLQVTVLKRGYREDLRIYVQIGLSERGKLITQRRLIVNETVVGKRKTVAVWLYMIKDLI